MSHVWAARRRRRRRMMAAPSRSGGVAAPAAVAKPRRPAAIRTVVFGEGGRACLSALRHSLPGASLLQDGSVGTLQRSESVPKQPNEASHDLPPWAKRRRSQSRCQRSSRAAMPDQAARRPPLMSCRGAQMRVPMRRPPEAAAGSPSGTENPSYSCPMCCRRRRSRPTPPTQRRA